MKHVPNLSDLQIPGQCDSIVEDTDDLQRIRTEHNVELSIRKRELLTKVQSLEKKLSKHELKEGMLERIINETYVEMDNLQSNEFSRRGQKQSILIKQMEALSILQATLLSYEDMIFKYQKILIDIENNKLNSFLKIENLKKEEKINDDSIAEVLIAIQEQLKTGSSASSGSLTSGVNPLIEEIQKELEESNY